jgi:hypothetical protein
VASRYRSPSSAAGYRCAATIYVIAPDESNNRTKPAKAQTRGPTASADRAQRSIQYQGHPETIARFLALADKNGWVFGEALDRTLDVLQKTIPEKD